MHVIMPRSSTLNPDAPLFIPTAYRTVDDFSDQWWSLIQSSPWFRDYWLRECFHDPQNDVAWADVDDDDLGFVLDDGEIFSGRQEAERQSDGSTALVKIGGLNWGSGRVFSESLRSAEKVPKIVKHKMSPRTIHQPR